MPLAYAIMPVGKNDKSIPLDARKPPEGATSGGFRISVDTIYKSRYNLLTLYRKEFVMHTSQETIWQSSDLRNDMKAHIELLEILAEAEADVQNSRTAPAADTFNALRASLQKDSLKV